MNIVLDYASIAEFGIYEESGAIVLGLRFANGSAIRTLMIQIADPTSDLQQYQDGMYVEIDDKAFVGGVLQFKYEEQRGHIHLMFNPSKSGGVEDLRVELPRTRSASDESLLRKLWSAYCSTRPIHH